MNRQTQALIAEGIGTFIFFTIGAGSIITDQMTGGKVGLLGIAAAHGVILAIMVSAFGHISGGHFNPAVTTGLWAGNKIGGALAALYIGAQLVGAVAAGVALRIVFPENVWRPVHLGTPGLAPGVGFSTAVFLEILMTFFLVTAVYGTAVDARGPKIGGFAIGLTVFCDILLGGPLTGASMNPARTFGPALVSGYWDNHLVYWIGPLIGGALAGLVYNNSFLETRSR